MNTTATPPQKTQVKKNVVAKASNKNDETFASIPAWFIPEFNQQEAQIIRSSNVKYLYIPWISEHSNALVANLGVDEFIDFLPLNLVKDLDQNRRDALRFAREQPDLYRKMILKRLTPIKNEIQGVIFTFDWAPVMRIISHVCEELGIPRILIPHESVFVDRDKYYWDPKANASLPLADFVLGWGDLQKSIFIERGYPEDRFITVGAPKFDKCVNYVPSLTKEQFCRIYALEPNKPIILFASQPLDSQLNTRVARESQRKAIIDLISLSIAMNLQLIIRLPPSKDNILNAAINKQVRDTPSVVIDDATCYLSSPSESLAHSDIIASINSTMLFEGLLMGCMPISTKYVEFKQIWEKCNFPIAHNKSELEGHLEGYLSKGYTPDPDGLAWAAKEFSNGAFDGQSATRILNFLKDFSGNTNNGVIESAVHKVFNSKPLDIIGIPSSQATLEGPQRYIKDMLSANKIFSTTTGIDSKSELASIDLFLQWGMLDTQVKIKQRELKSALGRELIFLEDGFLRSKDIGLSGEPALSIIMDKVSPYYDATNSTSLENSLCNSSEMKEDEVTRIRAIVSDIKRFRLSKYNSAPDVNITIGTPGKKKVLLIDQRRNDNSVKYGLANNLSFKKMLDYALTNKKDYDIIIKRHPDSISGGKECYFDNDTIAFSKDIENLHVIDYNINPHSLFDIVDEVFVVTSGIGFEALMSDKKVYCFGVPFYAGYGLTQDMVEVPRRNKNITKDTLFFQVLVTHTRYYSPKLKSACQVEDVIDYLADCKN